MNRFMLAILSCFFVWFSALHVVAVEETDRIQPTENPYLWRIEGETPSYLFGTIHLPDPRVTTFHPEVVKAIRGADAIYTEVPLDMRGTMALMAGMRLPEGETITKILPPDLYERLNAEYTRVNPALSLKMMDRQKLFIAMSAPVMLEQQFKYPGKQGLDQQIWKVGEQLGKTMGGIETMQEHIKVFDALTVDEQIEMLRFSLDYNDKLRASGDDPVEDMVQIYLSGSTDQFRDKFFEATGEDNEIMQKFYAAIMTVRNEAMAKRIHDKFSTEPGVSRFCAIGAAHYADSDGLIDLLTQKGLKITRVVTPPKTDK